METNDPSGRLAVEDLSDCRSESSHSESQLRAFQDYERIKELNLSVDKSKDDIQVEPKDFHLGLEPGRTSIRFDDFENANRNLPMTLNKGKDFGYIAGGLNEMAYPLDRSSENDESMDTSSLCRSKNPTAKDLLFNLRENRHKNVHAALSLDRYGKDLNFAVSEKDIKDFGLLKNYSLDRMKEFNLSLDRMRDSHIGNFALERLRGSAGLLENPPMMDHNELKGMQMQPRNQDLEAIALERMRRSHLLGTDLTAQNLSTQLPHPHSITQMQHSQQQQQQQAKSFTIDAILGLRNNPREKRSQQQQYRKHQGQEGGTKNGSSSSCSSGGGKLKRVRTIFTAEQLERLEGEFARQQYMVGPERLYLAHALRLTEAQVKVWFQNRRIKWRKHHHEQQSQRVHEFQRSLNSSLEHEDSNETDKWIPESTTYYSSPPSYKPQRGHVCTSPTYTKYTTLHGADAAHPQSHSKPRDKHYTSFSPTRKARYNEELANVAKLKLTNEDLENIAQENVQDDVEEEPTEDDREGAGEFLDKEYEEQEADDEIEEESDASPLVRRAQRGNKNDTMLRQSQRWRAMEQQADTRRVRCQQCVPSAQNHPSPTKYYHAVAEHEVLEPLSDEDFVRTSLRSPTRRQPAEYRQWSSPRNDSERYDDAMQSTRRSSIKSEGTRLTEPELVRIRKCNRCGSLSTSKRTEIPVKTNCRFDDRANIPSKGPIGDEPESQAYCGRCNLRYSTKDTSEAIDIPSFLYHTKFRKPRELKSPAIYEVPEQGQMDNKLSNEYTRSRYQRKAGDMFVEKSKRSLHTSHGTARIPSRYTE